MLTSEKPKNALKPQRIKNKKTKATKTILYLQLIFNFISDT